MAKRLTPLQVCLKERDELITYQRAFSDWLSNYKFTTFGTFTTKQPLHLTGARRMAAKFGHYIKAGLDSSMFWAVEPFDAREGFHFHALINTYGKISNQQMKDYWQDEKRFGVGQFLGIRRALGKENTIENYCSKYITKHLADYDIYTCKSIIDPLDTRSTGLPEKPDYISKFNHYDYSSTH